MARRQKISVLLIDNYDSFSYNLADLIFRACGHQPRMIHNDEPGFTPDDSAAYSHIVISPGPGHPDRPEDFGLCAKVITTIDKPILGVCLGHQGIASQFGGKVIHTPEPVHGLIAQVWHTGDGLFSGLPSPVPMVRYHSLVVALPLPEALQLTAWTDGGLVMALQHNDKPIFGVQFHPESICSEHGETLMRNFLKH